MKGIKFVLCTVVFFSGVLCGEVCGQTNGKYTGERAAGFSRSTVNFGVVVSVTPSVVCEKEKVVFSATLQAGDAGPYSYKWYRDGNFVSDSASFTKTTMNLADAGKYHCEVTNRSGETVRSDTIACVVNPIPVVNITAPSDNSRVCYGDTLVLKGQSTVAGADFSWQGPGLTNTSGTQAKAFLTADSRYVLRVSANGCSAVDSVKVRMVHPTVDIPYILNVSEGATATITATDAGGTVISPATGLTWKTNGASSAMDVNPFSVGVTTSLSEVYVSYDREGCVVYDTVRLSMKGGASFVGGENDGFSRSVVNFGVVVSATPSEVCENEKVVFSATLRAGDAGPYTYKWYRDGTSVSDSASFTKAAMSLGDAGKYYCKVTNRSGVTVCSDTIACVVNPIPTAEIITPAQDSVMVCFGDTLRLEARSVADADFSWQGPGLINTSGTQAKAFPTSDCRYVLRVSANGCSATDTLRIRLNCPTVDVPYVLNVSEGGNVTVTAKRADGSVISPATGLTWKTNVPAVSGSDVNPFSFTMSAGVEKVYVSYDQEGCVVSDSMLVNMKGGGSFLGGLQDGFARSSVNFGVKLVNFPMEVCAGVDTALNAQVVCVDNPDDYKVEWFKLNPAGSKGTTKRFVLSPVTLADSGSYYCKVTNKAGVSIYSDTMHMTVNEVPVAKIVDPSAREKLICWGDTLQVMGNSSVVDATLTWQGASIVGPVNSALTKVAPLTETDYIFRADNRGCWTEDTLTVKINHPFVDIPYVLYATAGSPLQLTALDSAGTALPATGLSWNIKPSTFVGVNQNPLTLSSVDHDMVVEVTLMAEGCSATDSTRVLVKGAGAFHGGLQDGFTSTCLPPVILVQPDAGTNQCVTASKSLELHVVAEGTGIIYQWEKWDDRESRFKPFVPSHSGVTGEHSPTLKFATIQEPDNGMYRCVLNGQCGEELITDTCTVSVKGEPIILSGINVDRDICAGSGEFEFNVIARNSAGTGNLHFRWYKNTLSNQISREADTLLNYYKLDIGPTGAEEGLYIVEVTNACGSVYDSAYLPVVVPPKIVEQSADVKVCYGGNAELYVKTNRDERYHYVLYELTDYPSLATKKKIEESYMNKFVVNGVTKGGYYQIKVFHPFCDSTFSNPIVVDLEYPITINGVSSDTTLCAGESLRLRADASTLGTAPLSYRWFKDGMPLAAATQSNTWNLSNLSYERDTVLYYCEVSNSCGTVRSRNIAVAVKRAPVIASGPELLPEYCEGDTLRAQVMLLSKPSEVDSVRWFYKGKRLTDVPGHISGSTDLTLEIDSLRPGDGDGYYYMEIYNGCGVTRSNQVQFTLFELARFVKGLDGVRLLMCDGDKTELMVLATGSEPIRYIWTQSGEIVADGYSNRLQVDASKVDKTETFICHIQNMCSKGGELTEAYVTASRPEAFDFSGGGSYCERDEIGVEACLQGSDTSVLYHLYRKPGVEIKAIHGRDVVPMTGPLCFEGIVGTGTYYVVAEDTNGCTAVMPGEAEVKENPLPKDFALQIRKQLCENTDSARVELTGSELGIVYDLCKKNSSGWDTLRVAPWPWAGTGAPLFFDVTEGEYKVVAKNEETGCVRDLSTALTVVERPVPQECDLSFWKDDSVYCRNAAGDVRIDLGCFETGCSYSLLKDGTELGRVVSAAPVYWTGLDEGVYSVKAVNGWGCETEFGHKEVTTQEPPALYTLIGKTTYCENETDSSWLELEGSEPGVIYSFRYLPGTVYKDVPGTGGDIFIRVPLIERDYYVIARDTTPEHCEIAMYDTVQLRKSRLDVSVTSPVYVNYGDTTVLNITVTGAEGDVSYTWTPADKLKPGHDVKEDPTTVAMTKTTLFTVTVTDASGCPVTKVVRVIVLGGDFGGEIVDGGNNPVDTVQLCAGDMLDLYASVSGGACNGNYIYEWSNETGVLAGGATLTPISPESDTKIYLHVDCGHESVDDSVVVLVNPVASVDTIKDAGMRCIASGKPVEVRVNGSATSAEYYLQSSADRITWTDVTSLAGTGGALQFTLPDAAAYFGKYLRIVARMPHKTADGGYCETEMEGELEILQAPADFGLSDGWAYCADAPVDSMIVMDGSEHNVTYRLMHLNDGVKFTKTGTGSALKFEPVRDSGKYVVQAVLGRCVTMMPDTVEVVEHPMPGLDSLVGAGEYCKSECPIKAGIRGGEADVEYTFNSSNPNFSSLSWTGPGDHTFVEALCDTGRYTVMAENLLTGCKKEYGEIVLKEAPEEVAVTGGGEYCADSSGLTSGVCVVSPESGIFYGLYKVTASGREWVDTLRVKDGQACSFKKLDAGKYVVVAKIGDCERTMKDTVNIIRHELPGIGTLLGGGSYCTVSAPLTIGITKGEADVRYTLVCDAPGFTPVIRMGTDTLIFGTDFSTVGTYRVEAYNTVTGCKAVYDSVLLAPSPGDVEVSGGGEYCPDSNHLATSVCIASPEPGIAYELYSVKNMNSKLGAFVAQSDGSLCNSLFLQEGDYVVVGKVGDCERTMTDTVKVRTKNIYDETGKKVELKIEGNGCVDSTVVLYVEVAPAPYEYQLYHEGTAEGSPKTGTGGRLEWNISPAKAGKWSIKSVVDGCVVELDASVEIEETPDVPELKGDTLYCAGDDVKLWVEGAVQDVDYDLFRLPEDTLVMKGSLNALRSEFFKVTAGTYYVRAKRGNCEISGSTLKVDSVKTPVLPTIETNDCVEAGKGEMTLSGLSAGYDYKISGPVNVTLRTLASDTSLTDLPVGVYSVQVVDAKNGCESEVIKDTIREGVPNDTLIPPFAYCDGENGVKLQLSGVHMGVTYKILTEGGSVLATLTYPQATPQPFFAGEYGEGKYILRVERTSFPAGCYRETLFEVMKMQNPSSNIAVTLEGTAPVCDGNDYRVRLEHTAAGGLYVLMLQGNPVVVLDTLVGTGSSAAFADAVNKAGDYMIRAYDSLGVCTAMLDTVLTIHPLPEIWADDCDYCDTEDSGCIIAVKRMETDVLYRLNQLDTLRGPGSGSFKKQPAGVYEVIAENEKTGCQSKDTVTITAKPGPHEYAVVPGCYTPDDVFDLQTTGSDTGVDYFLYCDGTAVSSVAKPGTGSALHFGDQNVTGIYRVKAVAANGCAADMRDSVIVYHPQPAFEAEVNGSFCNGDTTGVSLSLKKTAKGWKYYVTNGYLRSDTLHRIDGGVLAWNKLYNGTNAVSILNGTYSFRAISPCGTDEEIGSLTVTGDTLPQNFPVVDKPLYYCAPEKFTIALAGSENGMKYIVERYMTSGSLAQTYPAVIGDGTTVPFVLGEFDKPGYYKIIADNGCPRQLDFWEVKGGQLPNLCPLTGDDMCWQSDADTLRIELSCRDNGVNYYLYRDVQPAAVMVDSLTSTWRPAPEMSFTGQTVLGCYYVVGVNASTGCRREMPERLCLNTSPAIYEVEPEQMLGDTLVLCRGVDSCIWLSGSEDGVGYELLRDGISVNKVTGTGNRLNMGHITESGVYQVNAYVCGVMMKDSVIVKVLELPSLSLESELRYCQGTSDSLKVLAVTSDRLQYNCYRPDGSLLSQCNGKADGSSFRFPASVDGEGYYVVEVVDENGCKYADSTKVVMEHYPDAYNITSSGGEYICRGGYVKLGLDGSENNVRYQLRLASPMEEVSEEEGTGSAFVFPKQIKKPGTYYVTATYRTGLGCSVDFGSYTLQLADTILPFEVESVVNSYCMTSSAPQGSIRLDGSQTGMEYYLTRDGEYVQGSEQTGNGGSLLWTGLEGKECDDFALTDGYIYRVVARDPVSGCERTMFGSDTIVAASPIRIIAREPNNVEIEKCEGSDMKFSVTATGCRMTYKWMRDGLTLKEGSEPYYNIDSVQISDYGVYECEITNSCGTVMTPKVTLMVRELVRLENPMPDEYVCDDTRKTVMFSSGFRNAETYTWYKLPDNTTVIGNRNYYELTNFQVSDSGTYVVVANNRCDAEVRDTARLLIGSTPTISVSVAVDTLCVGSYYTTPLVTSTSPFEWYLNGVKLGYSGSRYTVGAVSAADEGNYSVEVENACGKTVVPVATLFVDDTLKIVNISDSSMIRCPSDGAIELSIDVSPMSERTKFLWQDQDLNTLGTGNKLTVGPFAINSYHTYRVWFLNKCSSGSHNFRDINILVPDEIEVADPLRNVTLCADCTTDTVLRLGITKTMMIEYEWYYRQTEEEGTGVLVSTGDTVSIPTCTQNTGYYYCHYFNRCESKTTETSWVRIDTVPVVRSGLQNDTLCEGMSLRKELSATGGGLTYEWHMLFKDGRDSVFDRNLQAAQSSTDYGMWPVVTMELDSAQIWCRVFNSCGEDMSDTMLLRVYPKRELTMTPDVVTTCSGDSVELTVTLVTGNPAWEYTIRYPDNSEKTVSGISSRTHTLKVIQEGIYRIVSMKDADGCMLNSGLPESEVKHNMAADLVMSGTQVVCLDDTVEIRFSVTGGIGPWNIKVVDALAGGIAPEISGPNGLLLYGRDTVIRFPGEHTSKYSVNSVVDSGSGCNLRLQDSVIVVTVDTPLYINFTDGPWYAGQCHDLNLRDKLKPQLSNGVSLPSDLGHFFIEGVDRGTSGILPQSELRGDSCYRVRCEYTDSLGCKVHSDEIRVCVDSLPSGAIISSSISCESVATDFMLQLHPAGRIDSLVILQTRYKKGGASSMQLLSYNQSQLPLDGLFKLRLNWGDVGGADSCLVYEVHGIRDIHGCWRGYDAAVYDSLYRDTIWRHVDPKVDVQVRRSESKPWDTGIHSVNLAAGDSVQVKVTLTDGMPLWSLPTLGIDSIAGRDTIFWLKDTGTYYFAPTDVACGRQGDKPWYDLTLTRLDTGYFRGRVFLEGVFYESTMSMAWGNNCNWTRLKDSLRLPSSLPLLPSGLKVIDWIEVELRISNGSLIDSVAVMSDSSFFVTRDTCLVLSDGHLADRWTGDTVVGIRGAYGSGANQRYVAVRHRNHLGVMTNGLHRFVNKANKSNTDYVDFTDTVNIYHRSSMDYHMTKKGNNGKELWVLAVGSLDSNYLISLSDPNHVTLEDIKPSSSTLSPLKVKGYRYDLLHDVNLDGCVDWPNWNGTTMTDWLFVERNRSKYTEIRWLDNK